MPGLLRAADSLLLIVDVQARLAPHVHEHQRVIDNCEWLAGVAEVVGVPVLVSEHCPDGIGPTVERLRARIAEQSVMPKVHFSCVSEPSCKTRIDAAGRSQIVIAGMEAHVCVMQTAIELAEAERQVFVVADAVSSRDPHNAARAIARMQRNGVEIVTCEMVLFEWARRGATEQFRNLHRRFLKQPSGSGGPRN